MNSVEENNKFEKGKKKKITLKINDFVFIHFASMYPMLSSFFFFNKTIKVSIFVGEFVEEFVCFDSIESKKNSAYFKCSIGMIKNESFLKGKQKEIELRAVLPAIRFYFRFKLQVSLHLYAFTPPFIYTDNLIDPK